MFDSTPPPISLQVYLSQLLSRMEEMGDRPAFCIADTFFSYKALSQAISKIRTAMQSHAGAGKQVGLVTNDDLETYASIFALWLEGRAYLPLHPLQPIERNLDLISQADIELIIDSGAIKTFPAIDTICSATLVFDQLNLRLDPQQEHALAYLLFTSGSTGKPKGVALTRANLAGFVQAFDDLGYRIDHTDRCLQPFDLTFDLSVVSYLIPLLKGACVYTIASDQIKYNAIAHILDDYAITVALMVPSTIRYLRPYFSEIKLPALRYSQFCGEALPIDLLQEWSQCAPNAIIDNVYGPTENTIYCSSYRFIRNGANKAYQGIVSIGKAMSNGRMIVVDEDHVERANGEHGELCLSGTQLTPGYWKNPEKNQDAFFTDSLGRRFYKTGDICFKDADGDFLYVGRIDCQVKIQGYRVELGEIEHHARAFLDGINAVAIALENVIGNTVIVLFVEDGGGGEGSNGALLAHLQTRLAPYMIPGRILYNKEFPLNANGKVDRNRLKKSVPA